MQSGLSTPCSGQAGFTLMELLVAMALAAIVGLAVYSLSSSVMGAYDHARKVRQHDYGFIMLGEVVREDLRSTYPGDIRHEDFYFTGKSYGSSDDPFLTFATSATLDLSVPEKREGLYLVRYFLEQDDDSETYNFIREEYGLVGLDAEKKWKKVVIAQGIAEFEIEYSDPGSREWGSEWKTPSNAKRGTWVPHGVKMRLSFSKAPDLYKEILVVLPKTQYQLVKSAF